jgi:hypothetical protein
MSEIKTPEGVAIRVTGRPPDLFLEIVTPGGLHFGWPVRKGETGYKVAEEITTLAGKPGEVVPFAKPRGARK